MNGQHAGSPCPHSLLWPCRPALTSLTSLRLHMPQPLAGLLFDIGQADRSGDVRWLLALIKPHLPCPEVWTRAPPVPVAAP
jgi:hypothetical protein